MRDRGICVDKDAEATGRSRCAPGADGRRLPDPHHHRHQDAGGGGRRRPSASHKGSELGRPAEEHMAAVVAIDPTNGRVLAYYGGDNGTGTDYAGKNTDSTGGDQRRSLARLDVQDLHPGGRAQGRSMSLESRWKGTAVHAGGHRVQGQQRRRRQPHLRQLLHPRESSTLKSLQRAVLLRHRGDRRRQGRRHGQAGRRHHDVATDTNPAKAYDLTKTDPKDIAPEPFFNVVGYGQYPITVLDHANGVATLRQRGRLQQGALRRTRSRSRTRTPASGTRSAARSSSRSSGSTRSVVDDVDVRAEEDTRPLSTTALDDGRKAAAKTGTWELNDDSRDNGDAWMIGYTPQLATAVWVGNVRDREAARSSRTAARSAVATSRATSGSGS